MALTFFTGTKGKVINGLLSAVATMAILSACGSKASQISPRTSGGQSPSAGLDIELTADRFEFTAPEQLCGPLLTAEVVVGSHGTARWNTKDGKLPSGVMDYQTVVKENLRVYTPVMFSKFAPLVDHSHIATKEFLTVGGQVGNDRYFNADDPTLPGAGGHYIVVLYPSTPQIGGNTEEALVVGYSFPVDSNGVVTLRQAGNPNEPGTGQRDSAITVPLTSLKQTLAACK